MLTPLFVRHRFLIPGLCHVAGAAPSLCQWDIYCTWGPQELQNNATSEIQRYNLLISLDPNRQSLFQHLINSHQRYFGCFCPADALSYYINFFLHVTVQVGLVRFNKSVNRLSQQRLLQQPRRQKYFDLFIYFRCLFQLSATTIYFHPTKPASK